MSSTFLNIKTYKSKVSYSNRLSHNARKYNLKGEGYKYGDEEYLNIVFLNNKDGLKQPNTKKEVSRTDLSKKIAHYKYKLKTAKKPKTIAKYEQYISDLEQQRENTVALNTLKTPKKQFIELTFSITDLSKRPDLLRNQNYLQDLNIMFLQYLKDKLPNITLNTVSGHLDQTTPHIHINGNYSGEHSLYADLGISFGNKKQYKDLQRDFNLFIREHELTKKYNLEVKSINNTSRNYLKLDRFKALQKECELKANKKVDNYLAKLEQKNAGFLKTDKDAVIKALRDALVKEYRDRLINKNTPSTIDEVLKDKEFDINKYMYAYKQIKPIADKVPGLEAKVKYLKQDLAESKSYNKDRVNQVVKEADLKINILEQKVDDLTDFIKQHNLERDFINRNDNNITRHRR